MRDRSEPTREEMRRIDAAYRREHGIPPSDTAGFLARLEARRSSAEERRLAMARDEVVLDLLAALHGPPPGNDEGRRAWGFRATYERIRAEGEAKRARAVRVAVEGGPVLWERPPST